MNNTHKKTLAAIFGRPVPTGLVFARIEALLEACGCEKTEGDGSRVRFSKGDELFTVHRPHPGKEAKPYQIRAAREYLERIGIEPGGSLETDDLPEPTRRI